MFLREDAEWLLQPKSKPELSPAASDVHRALTFIAQVEQPMAERETDTAKRHPFAWESFCKALLSTNEFIYVN